MSAITGGKAAPPAEPVRAPRGTALSCKGWIQEAALRMLMNNLDPEVAENPDQLIVYGGAGKAARNWACYHAIVRTLRELEADETLLRAEPEVAVPPAEDRLDRVLRQTLARLPRVERRLPERHARLDLHAL